MVSIAVSYDNGRVNEHFGHTKQFKIYEVEDKRIVASRTIDVHGSTHTDVVKALLNEEVSIILCNLIGSEGRNLLWDGGIDTFAGITGDADKCVLDFLSGDLMYIRGYNCPYESKHNSCICPDGTNCGLESKIVEDSVKKSN